MAPSSPQVRRSKRKTAVELEKEHTEQMEARLQSDNDNDLGIKMTRETKNNKGRGIKVCV